MKQISTFLVAALLSLSLFAQTNTTDSLALVSIYNASNGAGWTNNTNWLTPAPVPTWYGVTVTGDRVTALQLDSNNLTGPLAPELNNLTELVTLDLSFNNLTRRIPRFDALTQLEIFNLGKNRFTSIAPVAIGNLTSLREFRLDSNQLSGTIPPQLSKLLSLEVLDLSYNQFTGDIPPQLGNLLNLTFFSLKANQLTGDIPLKIAELTNLNYLYLNDNQLTGSIPTQFGNLRALTDLHLDDNQLSGTIPNQLSNLTQLDTLSLQDNNLTGEIPQSFKKLVNLKILNLRTNSLTGNIPTSFKNLTNLMAINVSRNLLSGTLPPELLTLPNLTKVKIQQNNYTFAGLEAYVQHNFDTFVYAQQNKFDLMNEDGLLVASVGGTPANNTYTWYQNDVVVAVINADSTYQPTESGTYRVKVTNSIATDLNLKSNEITVTVSPFAKNKSELIFKASPNPVATSTRLSFNLTGNCTIKLTNFSGQVLQTKTISNSQGLNTVQMDLSRYIAGTYYVTISNNKNETKTLQLNKQ